jgi:hypothetical protein
VNHFSEVYSWKPSEPTDRCSWSNAALDDHVSLTRGIQIRLFKYSRPMQYLKAKTLSPSNPHTCTNTILMHDRGSVDFRNNEYGAVICAEESINLLDLYTLEIDQGRGSIARQQVDVSKT